MTDLAAWLLARIAEDEETARAAGEGAHDGLDGRWVYWPGTKELSAQHDHPDGFVRWHSNFPAGEHEEGAPIVTYWQEDAEHIARHDPARVLAECAAKRRIVELHAITVAKVPTSPFDPETGEPNEPEYEVECAICGWASDVLTSACPTLRLLAQPYAGAPGWDEAWKVET